MPPIRQIQLLFLIVPALFPFFHASAGSGPTLQLSYDAATPVASPIAEFMYFVPLISEEPVSVLSRSNATQRARVLSLTRRDSAHSFTLKCEFEFFGAGSHCNLFDHAPLVHRRQEQLKQGRDLQRLLTSITVEGPGLGTIEVEGTLSNQVPQATEIRMRFNAHGKSSPVSILLEDIHYQNGQFIPTNGLVARVNTLTFTRKPGPTEMEVTVASVKPKAARDNFWQNFKGAVAGAAVNCFIPPLKIRPLGHQTMLDFGLALATRSATFTFPQATNLAAAETPH
jgi:hypothetical protein